MPSGFTVTPITFKARKPLAGATLTATIHAKFTREFYIRFWLGTQLIRVAAWILGCNVQVENGRDKWQA